jgi:hypothetical protein
MSEDTETTEVRQPVSLLSAQANAESRPGNPDCTGVAETCERDHGECLVCAARECPFGEPLHFHHDGCPVCDGEFGGEPELIAKELAALREVDRG